MVLSPTVVARAWLLRYVLFPNDSKQNVGGGGLERFPMDKRGGRIH